MVSVPGGTGYMKRSGHIIAGLALAYLLFAAPVTAQAASMQVGNATVSVGAGTAILTLPDVPSVVLINTGAAPFPFISNGPKFSDDFDDEIGWNVNGSIEVPMGANRTVSLNGFWANIDDEDSATCSDTATTNCAWYPLVDNPATTQARGTIAGEQIVTTAKRDVDHWGASLESKWQMNPGVMGVTQAPHRRTFALGADIRGIDQDLDVALRFVNAPATIGPATYSEDLNTRYYGAYAAWGGDYSIPFLSGLTGGLGLQSSFLLRGGIYYADTDYEGRLVDSTTIGNPATSALSLSGDDVSFIGGLVLETKKRIGQRTTLSLKSEYEYYSYVPEMSYNQVDTLAGAVIAGGGGQVGTRIGSDDAFSARTSLRLTIKLGPDSLFEEPLK